MTVQIERGAADNSDLYPILSTGRRPAPLEAFPDPATELREALNDGQLVAHYQPIVRMSDGQVVAVEALARWDHPRRGRLAPAEFLPAANSAGLVLALDEEILAQACEQAVSWNFARSMHHLAPLSVSVNVTAIELQDPGYPARLSASLQRTGLPAQLLWLEVTEEAPITDWPAAQDTVGRLRDMGARLVIDDLGAGYSSLERLARLAPAGLKLDARFVQEVPASSSASVIASAVCLLAWRAGIRAVAEGVERPGQAQALRIMGWELGQGYLWSCPQAAKDLGAVMVEGRCL